MKRLQISLGLFLVVVGLVGVSFGREAAAVSAPTVYYLALGDSLSTGGGADPGLGYVDDIDAQLNSHIPGLQLEDLGCGGDSTTRMINGGLCHNYTTGNQLGDAELFLQAHAGQVAFVTIDVGGDDIDGCGINGTINPTCVGNALNAINRNLPIIMSGLRTAGGTVPIVGMNYYDPYLAAWYSGAWFHGSPSKEVAKESLPVLHSLNKELTRIYRQYNAEVANVQSPFHSNDWRMTGSYSGTALPQNVANICNWTHMCMTGGGNPNIHATDYGHSLIADAYEKVIRVRASISGSPPPASVGAPYAFQFTVGGYPKVRASKVGKLPTGLTLSGAGVLSGTPTKAGTYTVTVRASDSSGSGTDTTNLVVS